MSVSIAELLTPGRIHIGLEVHSKKKLLEEMAGLLANGGDEDEGPGRDSLFKLMCQREQLGSTGIGNGVALPHCRIPGLKAPRGALALLQQPLPYESPDSVPVSMAFGLAVPEDASREHLEILSQLARLFSDSGRCRGLSDCSDAPSLQRMLSEGVASINGGSVNGGSADNESAVADIEQRADNT